MWIIIINEWKYFFRNKIFNFIFLFLLIILFMTILLGYKQVQAQNKEYFNAKSHLRKKWENLDSINPHGAAHYGTYVIKSNNLLSSLDNGVNDVTGNILRVEGHIQNEFIHSESSQMMSISKFGKLKTSLILQYFFPILILFLGFQCIIKEKKSSRIKLLILQKSNKFLILISKTIAIWIYISLILTLTIGLFAMVNMFNINIEILLRTFFFYISYLLYFFILSALSIFFSAYMKEASSSLSILISLWIIWTIFFPNIALSSIDKLYSLPSRNQFKSQMSNDRAQGIDGHNPNDVRSKKLEEKVLSKYNVSNLSDLPINFDGVRMQADEEYGNKVWDKHFGNINRILLNQKKLYQLFGILNPFISLKNISMGLASSDNFHHQDFVVKAELYRRNFIKRLNDEHAYGGSKTGDWSWTPDKNFYKSILEFKYKTLPINVVFKNNLTDFIMIIIWVIISLYLLFLGSKKLEIL